MGLDMYLNSSKHGQVKYWRKANQIHAFFDSLTPNGLENCKKIRVGIKALRELKRRCELVLASFENAPKKTIVVQSQGSCPASSVTTVAEYEATHPGQHLRPVVVLSREEASKEMFYPTFITSDCVKIGDHIYKVGDVWRYDVDYDCVVFEDTSVAEDLLPTQCGFFFGGTEYDGYYLEDIKDTLEMLNKVLTDPSYKGDRFYYYGWW